MTLYYVEDMVSALAAEWIEMRRVVWANHGREGLRPRGGVD